MKAPSKKDRYQALLSKIDIWKKEGKNPADMLTADQFDFLVDMDYNTDLLVCTPEQIANAKSIKVVSRRPSPNGYNKEYPQAKIDCYNAICNFLTEQGYEIERPKKENYRDLYLTKDNVKYKIVLSVPRS